MPRRGANLFANADRRHPRGRATIQKLEAVALHPIEVRLARLLLSTAELQAPEPVGKRDKVAVELGISQSEIGLLIGASRPKVNAAFSLLEAEGARRICHLSILALCAARDE